jgi:hypothetical protein
VVEGDRIEGHEISSRIETAHEAWAARFGNTDFKRGQRKLPIKNIGQKEGKRSSYLYIIHQLNQVHCSQIDKRKGVKPSLQPP